MGRSEPFDMSPPFWSPLHWPCPPGREVDVALLNAVASRFPALRGAGPLAFSTMQVGTNSINYLIEASAGKRYVLKRNLLRKDPAQIDAIIDWTAAFPAGALRCKEMLRSDERRYALSHGPDAAVWEMSRFMNGERYAGNVADSSRLGHAVGFLHEHMRRSGGPPVAPAHYWNVDEPLDWPRGLETVLAATTTEPATADRLSEAVRRAYDRVGAADDGPVGWAHGDLHLDNILFQREGNGVFIFDFDFTRVTRGGELLDLGTLLHRTARDARIAGCDPASIATIVSALLAGFETAGGTSSDLDAAFGYAMAESLRKIQACVRLIREQPDGDWSMLATNHAIFLGEMLCLSAAGDFVNDR